MSRQHPEGASTDASRHSVAIGYVVRAKGIRGEVKVEPLTHSPERFDELSEVLLERRGDPERILRIEGCRPDAPGLRIKFAGVDSPEVARDTLVEGYLTVPREDVADLPSEDTFYVFNLVGCRVEDQTGESLGEVVDVLEMPSTDVFVIRRDDGREIMVPAVGDFIAEVSIDEKRLVVRGVQELIQ